MKILSYDYEVVREPGFSSDRNNNNNARWQGQIDYKRQQIKVDPEDKEHMQTLIHEMMHSIDRYFVTDLSEDNIERISQGIYHVMTENGVDLSPLLK